jgi:hypothetical protein
LTDGGDFVQYLLVSRHVALVEFAAVIANGDPVLESIANVAFDVNVLAAGVAHLCYKSNNKTNREFGIIKQI